MLVKIPCVVMRGGTSRGLFFRRENLPEDQSAWAQLFCTAMGTPDPKQVDGLGGGTSSTSKVVVVSKSERPGIDVDYVFVQVGVDKMTADIGGDCGNLSAAVGPFAIDEGLAPAVEPDSIVNMFNTSTGKRHRAKVKVRAGKFDPEGGCSVSGLVQKGSEIIIDYLDPAGAMTGRLLPTGRAVDRTGFDGKEYRMTVVDCTNPYVFVSADELGMTGAEPPSRIDYGAELRILQDIRDQAAERIGLGGQSFPKVAVVGRPLSVGPSTDDLVVRTISLGRAHKTIPLTAALCLAAAARIPGTLPWSLMPNGSHVYDGETTLSIAHPEGSIAVSVDARASEQDGIAVTRVTGVRTARRIMEGFVYI